MQVLPPTPARILYDGCPKGLNQGLEPRLARDPTCDKAERQPHRRDGASGRDAVRPDKLRCLLKWTVLAARLVLLAGRIASAAQHRLRSPRRPKGVPDEGRRRHCLADGDTSRFGSSLQSITSEADAILVNAPTLGRWYLL